jgi:anti-anti-sigma factor
MTSSADIEHVDGVAVARPRGDIDTSNALPLRDDLADSLGSGTDELVLDLTSTRYVDSAGIDMLFRLAELMRQRRAILRLVITTGSQLDRLSDIVGLRSAVAVYDTVPEALAAPPKGGTSGGLGGLGKPAESPNGDGA